MPVYEYLCEACGKPSEAIQKFSDGPLTDCEDCGAKGSLKKLISKSSFALKGSGWYTTDYKKSSKPAAPPDSAAPAAAAASPDGAAAATTPAKVDSPSVSAPSKIATPPKSDK
jgi:putative FmdB family regulatory protein